MIKRVALVAVLVLCGLAATTDAAEKIGMAVKVRNYGEVRSSAGAFLSQFIADYYDDLPDSWIAPALNSGSMESIDKGGDFYFLGVESPQGTAWVCIAPLISARFYLDALRANLGRETRQEGIYVFTAGTPPDAAKGRDKFYVQIVDGTAVASRDEGACRLATSMLKEKRLDALFDSGHEAPVRIRIAHDFIEKKKEGLFETLRSFGMLVAASMGSLQSDALAKFYAQATLDVVDQAERLYVDVSADENILSAYITILLRPQTPLANFLGKQQPMKTDLLEMLPGSPVFACAGRVESVGELRSYYSESVKRLYALNPSKAALAEAASKHAAERLRGFAAVAGGHFAAALVMPPKGSFAVDYLRVYEVKDPVAAKEAFVLQTTGLAELGKAVKPVPEHADPAVLTYEIWPRLAVGKTQPLTVSAAFTDKLMLVASGKHSKDSIRKMIDACARKPSEQTVAQAPHFATATVGAPEGASVLAFFSLSGFFNWAGRSGAPGTDDFQTILPTGGIAAWFVPADGTLGIHLRIPVGEFVALKRAVLGDTPIIGLPM